MFGTNGQDSYRGLGYQFEGEWNEQLENQKKTI